MNMKQSLHQLEPADDELHEARKGWARSETMLAAALTLLPEDMAVIELRDKRDEIRETLAALVQARAFLKGLCTRARSSGQFGPHHTDIEAFLARLDRGDLIRAQLQVKATK